MKKIIILVLVVIGLAGCNSDPILNEEQQLAKDIELINEYIADNNIQNVIEHSSGIRYIVHEEGTGEIPERNWIVKVKFQGNLLTDPTGTPFEQSTAGTEYVLSTRIEGWQIILTEQQEGAVLTLYIPSGLGYGSNRSGPIPGNSNLIYEITLVSARP